MKRFFIDNRYCSNVTGMPTKNTILSFSSQFFHVPQTDSNSLRTQTTPKPNFRLSSCRFEKNIPRVSTTESLHFIFTGSNHMFALPRNFAGIIQKDSHKSSHPKRALDNFHKFFWRCLSRYTSTEKFSLFFKNSAKVSIPLNCEKNHFKITPA